MVFRNIPSWVVFLNLVYSCKKFILWTCYLLISHLHLCPAQSWATVFWNILKCKKYSEFMKLKYMNHKSYMLKMISECGLELCNVALQDKTWGLMACCSLLYMVQMYISISEVRLKCNLERFKGLWVEHFNGYFLLSVISLSNCAD